MKYLVFNRQSLLFTMLLCAFALNAQIQSTHTDTKYGYTTVVYKDTAASDADVLSALNNSIGMGDVVRVTVAPPKVAAIPTIDKSKGEDVWLKTRPSTINVTASTVANVPVNNLNAKSPAIVRIAAANPDDANAPSANIRPASVETKTALPALAEEQLQTTAKAEAAPAPMKTKSIAASKASKNSNKSLKKANRKTTPYKLKTRKKGKQRYGCPKF